MSRFFAFDLNHDLVVDDQVCPEPALQFHGFIDQRYGLFALNVEAKLSQFVCQARLIRGFKQPGPSLRFISMAAPMMSSVVCERFIFCPHTYSTAQTASNTEGREKK